MPELKSCPFCGEKVEIVKCEEPRLYRPIENHPYYLACYNCNLFFGFDEDYGGVFDTKKEAATAWNPRASGWILCSERMPEVGTPVLTFDGECYAVERTLEHVCIGDNKELHGEWWIDGYEGDEHSPVGLREGTAIAWMPLPEPPKGGESND